MQNVGKVRKEEVEAWLGYRITDSHFENALECAERKQVYIYEHEKREAVMQRWYLIKLTEEYARSLAFSKFTMDLCSMRHNKEKEHPFKEQGAQHYPYCNSSCLKNQVQIYN